jgi:hypothetical protein
MIRNREVLGDELRLDTYDKIKNPVVVTTGTGHAAA